MKNLFSTSKSASYLRIFLFILFLLEQNAISKTHSISLNGKWQVWFDSTARWQEEELVLEPENLSQVPQYPPTIGWDQMLELGEPISVPSTWEEKYPKYDGVAWYWQEFEIPFEYQGKVLRIQFWAVRHRAEVYLNQKLVGYNIEGFTPFEVDISDAVKYGAKNLLVVRVTDPGGGDNWRDYNPIPWGKVRLPDSHNFGGIWQDVELLITNRLYVDNIYIQPQEDLETILVQTTIQNKGTDQEVELILHVIPRHQSARGKPVVEHKQNLNCAAGQPTVVENTFTIPNPNLWSPESPSRYNLNVTVKSLDKVIDTYFVPFGVRFFTEKDGDLYLNGKRIFFKCSISWGYYPKTIAYPTKDLVGREIKNAKLLGLNALSAHRNCATPILLEMADSLGLMIYQEPGGAPRDREPEPKNSAEAFERELFLHKFQRLVRRDRNHPSLVWWNCANEAEGDLPAEPSTLKPYIDRMMKMVNREDPSRLLTYTSESGFIPMFRPYEHEYSMLMDVHTVLNRPIVWRDRLYLEHLHFLPPISDMVLINGESRCFTALSNLPKVVEKYKPIIPKSDGAAVKEWSELLQQDFDKLELKEDFKNPGNFCRLTGIVQGEGFGRLAGAMRLNPQLDGFALNGWHCHHILGTSGMVDIFRYPKFPPEILSRTMKPLCLAICPLPSVAYGNEEVSIQITLINESDLSGAHVLEVQVVEPDKRTIFKDEKKVFLKGSKETFVQPFIEYHKSLNGKSGYYHVQAKLKGKKEIILQEERDIFIQNVTDLNLPENNIYYLDGEDVIPYYLDKRRTFWYPWKQKFSHFYTTDLIFLFNRYTGTKLPIALDMVHKGKANLIWLEHDMEYARHALDFLIEQNLLPRNAEALAYPNKAWLGGWQFCKRHPIFDGLPSPAIFNWEYGEVFAPWGIQHFQGETIAGFCNAPPVMATTVGVMKWGKGKIVFCSLNLTQLLGKNPVADRIFTQIIKFAAK